MLDLPSGRYAYACSAHPQTMKKVTNSASTLSSKSLTAGSYRLTVTDRSKTRNFHLVGPGLNRKTGKAFTGKVTWGLELPAGAYKFGSDPRLTGRLVVRSAG